MNTKVHSRSVWNFLLVAALIVGAAALLVYYRTGRDAVVLNPPLRGEVKGVDDLSTYDDLYSIISAMKGYDVPYDDFVKVLSIWSKKHGYSPMHQYGSINTLDFITDLMNASGYEGVSKVYATDAHLSMAVWGKWIDGKLHLIGVFRYKGVPDMDEAPDFLGFRWWNSFFAVDKATGYVHMKYVMGTSTLSQAYFNQPIPATGLPATAYYTKFYERYVRRESLWWGNYLVNTDLWYADWGVLYVVLYPLEDFDCSAISFDYIHSFMSSGLDIDFHQVMGQIDVVLNPAKGSTSYFLPVKICKP